MITKLDLLTLLIIMKELSERKTLPNDKTEKSLCQKKEQPFWAVLLFECSLIEVLMANSWLYCLRLLF